MFILFHSYCIRSHGKWSAASTSPSTSLDRIASELQKLKEQVGDICAVDEDSKRKWRLHTQTTHPLSSAPKLLREQYNCTATSQAYCKFLEILVRYPRIVLDHLANQLRSFHLCEAPGHFISVLDRFLCTFYSNVEWSWEANSLNPHHEGTSACDMLLEDEIILRHPDRWHFGTDNSGDITKWDDAYISSILAHGQFYLVTADGGLYTQDSPGEQESLTLPLLASELNIAQRLLGCGGALIIKVYTLYMQETRDLIGRVASRFRDVYMFKPMSSKGGNNERYLVCMGFDLPVAKTAGEKQSSIANEVLIDCEAYFSSLQSSSIKANLDTYKTISKAELGAYRTRVLREFHKRTLTSFISNPTRVSHLSQEPVERPWMDMIGQNYVETLRQICDKRSATHFLKNFHQNDIMTDHEEVDSIEVEFSKEEIEFLGWSEHKLLHDKVIVLAPAVRRIVHSLFIPPDLLRCLQFLNLEVVSDLCKCSYANEDDRTGRYIECMEFSGKVTVDAYELRSQKDWCCLLNSTLFAVLEEKISQLDLVWSGPSTPFVLSRFSASVIAMLCVLFFQFRLQGGQNLATFTMPNYREDIPPGVVRYLSMLSRFPSQNVSIHSFVPTAMLAMLHPYLVELNRFQWRNLIAKENLSVINVDDIAQ